MEYVALTVKQAGTAGHDDVIPIDDYAGGTEVGGQVGEDVAAGGQSLSTEVGIQAPGRGGVGREDKGTIFSPDHDDVAVGGDGYPGNLVICPTALLQGGANVGGDHAGVGRSATGDEIAEAEIRAAV